METKCNSIIHLVLLTLLVSLAGSDALAGVPGGYQRVELNKPEVKAAADFAVQEQAKREDSALQLKAIVEAEEQVVAGMNYRLTLTVAKGDQTQKANAEIFRALDSHYELKSWEWLSK